jgi:hypothetical protein
LSPDHSTGPGARSLAASVCAGFECGPVGGSSPSPSNDAHRQRLGPRGFVRAALQCFIQSREPDVRGAPSKFSRGLPAMLSEVPVACPLSPRGGPRRFRLRRVRSRARRTMRVVRLDRNRPSGATANSVRTELSPDDSTGRAAGWLAPSARGSSPCPSNDAHPGADSSRARRTMRIVSGSGHGIRSGCAPMLHSVTRARRPRGPVEVQPGVARDPC